MKLRRIAQPATPFVGGVNGDNRTAGRAALVQWGTDLLKATLAPILRSEDLSGVRIFMSTCDHQVLIKQLRLAGNALRRKRERKEIN